MTSVLNLPVLELGLRPFQMLLILARTFEMSDNEVLLTAY